MLRYLRVFFPRRPRVAYELVYDVDLGTKAYVLADEMTPADKVVWR